MKISLTNDQRAVIEAGPETRVLVEAAAGSGKTEVVARRIAYLMRHGLKPREILVLSFSRSAVRVLTERLRQVSKESEVIEDLRWATVRTFDSWVFRVLRQLEWEPADLLACDFNGNMERVLEELKAGDAVLSSPQVRLGDVRHLIVDEMQDVTALRARLVQRLLELLAPAGAPGRGFTLLGDSCQAIYDWTGGDGPSGDFTSRDLLRWLKKKYGSSLRSMPLPGNHRTKPGLSSLLDGARQQLETAPEPDVALQALCTTREGLPAKSIPALAEEMLSANRPSMAVLCRDNGQVLTVAEGVEEYVAKSGKIRLPMAVVAGSPPRRLPSWIGRLFSRFEGAQLTQPHFRRLFGILKAGQVPCGGDPDQAWRMLLRAARLGETSTSLDMELLRQRIVWPDSLPDDEGEVVPPLVLTTIHQSKGREFDGVSLLASAVEAGDNAAEEARVIYVGLTRARAEVSRLQAASSESLYVARCWGDRQRRHRWSPNRKGAFHRLELGCEGDLEKDGFVRSDVLGSDEAVRNLQRLLCDREEELVGVEVTATKTVVSTSPLRVAYRLRAQAPMSVDEEICVGEFSDDVRRDIAIIKNKKQGLPKNIYNLRIGSVCTYVWNGELSREVPSPWRESRIWLGVTVHGLGKFETYWNSRQ